jgi:hypothetical protein
MCPNFFFSIILFWDPPLGLFGSLGVCQLNSVIPYHMNKFVNNVKSLIIIISQMGVFGGDDHKYVKS